MLSLAQSDGRRIWVILDELPTLHQVPSLQPGLAESRQFGGCFVLGVQVASALRDLYGRNGAETISGLCGTRAVLAAPDRDTAQWSADSLGRSEIEEVAEGYSYGANTIRDGVSLTPRRELRSLALPSEIMRLANLEGYLKFPGPFPVAAIRLNYVARPKTAARFVAREDNGTVDAGVGGAPEDADAAPCGDDAMTIPDPAEASEPGGPALPAPEDGPGPAPHQGELDLSLQPEAAGSAETEANGQTSPSDPAPEDGPPEDKAEEAAAPETGGDRQDPPAGRPAAGDGEAAAPDAGRVSDWA